MPSFKRSSGRSRPPFTRKYGTFQEWRKQAPETNYTRLIERLHHLHPEATLSQLRRHSKKGEEPLGEMEKRPLSSLGWDELTPREKELRTRCRKVFFEVKSGRRSLEAAARQYHVTPEAVRRNIDGFVKVDGRWQVKRNVQNEVKMRLFHQGAPKYVRVQDTRQASLIGRYHNGVKIFLRTHDEAFLRPFVGKYVKDSDGKMYELETDPRTLYIMWERNPEEGHRPIYEDN